MKLEKKKKNLKIGTKTGNLQCRAHEQTSKKQGQRSKRKKSQTCKNIIIVPRGQSLKGRVLSPTRTSEQVSNKI